jgi:hypothetical protein
MPTPLEALFASVVEQIPLDDYTNWYEIPVPLGSAASRRETKIVLPTGFHYDVARPATAAELEVLPKRAHPQGKYVVMKARRKVVSGALVPKPITPAAVETSATPF